MWRQPQIWRPFSNVAMSLALPAAVLAHDLDDEVILAPERGHLML